MYRFNQTFKQMQHEINNVAEKGACKKGIISLHIL